MSNIFQKAKLDAKKWRVLLRGTSGSGKTTSALILASQLGKKIALVDTEKLSSAHNAKKFDFDVVDYNDLMKNNHKPAGYIRVIEVAEEAGYDVLIIDSFSHVWMGQGGILDIVDSLTNTKYKGNSYRAWSEGNQLYQGLIDKILFGNNMHIILTGRTKQAYELANGKVIKKGMALQQRDGLDYEFDVVLDFSSEKPGYAIPEKDRTDLFAKEGEMVTKSTGEKMNEYYS